MVYPTVIPLLFHITATLKGPHSSSIPVSFRIEGGTASPTTASPVAGKQGFRPSWGGCLTLHTIQDSNHSKLGKRYKVLRGGKVSKSKRKLTSNLTSNLSKLRRI